MEQTYRPVLRRAGRARKGMWETRLKKFPDMHIPIEDIIAEGDKVVCRNLWRGTDRDSGKKIQFGGIVIWRIARGKIKERWAYLEPPKSTQVCSKIRWSRICTRYSTSTRLRNHTSLTRPYCAASMSPFVWR